MLITHCKVLCRPAHISIKSEGRENSSVAKKDSLEYAWNLVEKDPKFTILAVPQPKFYSSATFEKVPSYIRFPW